MIRVIRYSLAARCYMLYGVYYLLCVIDFMVYVLSLCFIYSQLLHRIRYVALRSQIVRLTTSCMCIVMKYTGCLLQLGLTCANNPCLIEAVWS